MTEPTLNSSSKIQPLFFWAAIVACIAITGVVFMQVKSFEFTNWDDQAYVVENLKIRQLDAETVKSFFKTDNFVMGNYHPLTILSYAIEYSKYKLDAGFYHRDNLIIHLMNTGLVFWMIWLLTGRISVCLIAALLFGIHPMHVESVAWISARKDLIYAFFFFSATIGYLFYLKAGRGKVLFYLLALLLFGCSLLSKGLAVTLPVVFLLIDFWKGRRWSFWLYADKVPFFIMAVYAGLLALNAQEDAGAIQEASSFSMGGRVVLASYSLLIYLLKLIVPTGLANFYPYPERIGSVLPFIYFFATLAILIGGGLVLYTLRYTKDIFFGTAYFLVTIVLVLQLIPVGNALMADRYTYVPFIGLFFLIGQAYAYVHDKYLASGTNWIQKVKPAFIVALILFISILSVVSWRRAGVWANSEALWTDMIKKHPEVDIGYNNRALAYTSTRKFNEAMADLDAAIRLNPNYSDAFNNKGRVYFEVRQHEEAVAEYDRAIGLNQDFGEAFYNRGLSQSLLGNYNKGLYDFSQAARLMPDNHKVFNNRGILLTKLEMNDKALEDYDKAILIYPKYAEAYMNRANLYTQKGLFDEALNDFNKSIEADPNYLIAYYARSQYYYGISEYSLALKDALYAKTEGLPVDDKYIQYLKDQSKNE